MTSFFKVCVLGIVGCLGLSFQGCQVPSSIRGPFVKTTYTDPTTEIVDHTLFDLVGTDPFYEDYWAYQRRLDEYEPDDSTGRRAFYRRYLRRRLSFQRPVILVAWPRLSSYSLSEEQRNLFLAAMARPTTDSVARKDKAQLVYSQLRKRLLRGMQGTWLRVEEMKNTGLYTLIAPSRGIYPTTGLYWPCHDWQSNNANRTPVRQFAVSQAVLDRSGTRACFLLEHQEPTYMDAEFIFAERRNGRWVLIKRSAYWTS
jgi:hypothetical protein